MAENVNELVQWLQRAYNMLGSVNERNQGRDSVPSQAIGGPFTPVSRAEKAKIAEIQRQALEQERLQQMAQEAVAGSRQDEFERSEGLRRLQKLVRKEGIEFGSVPKIQKTLKKKPPTSGNPPDYLKGLRRRPQDVGVYW
jgi:hypothetical protein